MYYRDYEKLTKERQVKYDEETGCSETGLVAQI